VRVLLIRIHCTNWVFFSLESGIIVDAENVLWIRTELRMQGFLYVRSNPFQRNQLFAEWNCVSRVQVSISERKHWPKVSKSIAAPPQAKNIPQHKADWSLETRLHQSRLRSIDSAAITTLSTLVPSFPEPRYRLLMARARCRS